MSEPIKYGDHQITLTADHRFNISGPLFIDDAKTVSAFQDAVEEIAKREKALASQQREKLAIPVVDASGNSLTITGIHGRNFNALGIGDARIVYPPEQWLIEALAERREMKAKLDTLDQLIARYEIDPRHYRLRSHEEAVAHIKSETAAKAELAAKGRP